MGMSSIWHWIILGIVILLLFGGNRFSSMMGDVAKGLKSFKKGMADEDEPPHRPAETRHIGSQDRPIDVSANPRVADPVAPPSDTAPRS